MRGLGIGIFVTALLMGIATKEGRPLTDAEIKAKAYELGMVDSDSIRLTDLKGSTPVPSGTIPPAETSVPAGTMPPAETSVPVGTMSPVGTSVPVETSSPRETDVPKETTAPQATAVPTPQATAAPTPQPATPQPTAAPSQEPSAEGSGSEEAVAIVIYHGANSYSVSLQLAEAGLIEDAAVFDSYLCNNGYAGKIQTGIYQIVPGTSGEQIAMIITGTR